MKFLNDIEEEIENRNFEVKRKFDIFIERLDTQIEAVNQSKKKTNL